MFHSSLFDAGNFVTSRLAVRAGHRVSGPLFDQAPASIMTLSQKGQSPGATSGAGLEQKTPTA